MAKTLETVAGNTAPPWVITCTRKGTGAITLVSASTVRIKIYSKVTKAITQAAGSCTITTAASGIISYVPATTDCPSAGNYLADIKITYNDGTFEVLYEQLKIKARAPL